MTIEGAVKFISFSIFLLAIVSFVSSISSKNKKVFILNIIISILCLIYDIVILPNLISYFGSDLLGLSDWLTIIFSGFLNCALLIISIVIDIVKLKKNSAKKGKKQSKKTEQKSYNVFYLASFYALLFILPPVMLIVAISSECNILSNADLVLRYGGGAWFPRVYTTIAVSERKCQIISNSKLYSNFDNQKARISQYYLELNNGEIKVESAGHGKAPNETDLHSMKEIVNDVIRRAGDATNADSLNIEMQKLGDSDYYITSITKKDSNQKLGGIGSRDLLYKGSSYYCSFTDDLEDAILLR